MSIFACWVNHLLVGAVLLASTIALPGSAQSTSPNERDSLQLGCLKGQPNGAFQGDHPLTRNEFAAGVNACLDQLQPLLPKRENLATQEDLQILIERQRQLNLEIKSLNRQLEPFGSIQPSTQPIQSTNAN